MKNQVPKFQKVDENQNFIETSKNEVLDAGTSSSFWKIKQKTKLLGTLQKHELLLLGKDQSQFFLGLDQTQT